MVDEEVQQAAADGVEVQLLLRPVEPGDDLRCRWPAGSSGSRELADEPLAGEEAGEPGDRLPSVSGPS